MQITIKDTVIAKMAAQLAENYLYDNWSNSVLKAAGVPKKADVVKEILADEKFMAQANKYLSNYINDMDVIYDAFSDADCNVLSDYEVACDKAHEKIGEAERAKRQAQDLKRMINIITDAGFTVTKA